MHYYVGKYDESGFSVPGHYKAHSRGYERVSLVDRACGSVHCEAGMSRLAPGGEVSEHVHAYEKGIYVFEGELDLFRDGEALRLPADSYALIPVATAHAFRNRGLSPARWFEILSPQPKPHGALKDTFFTGEDAWPAAVQELTVSAAPSAAGRFKPEHPLPRMSADLQQGLSVYRFMERNFGAQCFFMMRGEMAPGAFRTRHDHPIEEFYMGLGGEVVMDIEDQRFRLGVGDVAWTGVGTSHAFRHAGSVPFQWLETQTPQFPPKQGTRNYVEWEKLRAGR